jgi:redox-sensitive bicupin YhaK (pirin superfamily)
VKGVIPKRIWYQLRLIASPEGQDGSVTVHQDAKLYASVLDAGEKIVHELSPNRHIWVQVAQGEITVNGLSLSAGDAAAISEENQVVVMANTASEILLFDLA